jgi:hypothetical protein
LLADRRRTAVQFQLRSGSLNAARNLYCALEIVRSPVTDFRSLPRANQRATHVLAARSTRLRELLRCPIVARISSMRLVPSLSRKHRPSGEIWPGSGWGFDKKDGAVSFQNLLCETTPAATCGVSTSALKSAERIRASCTRRRFSCRAIATTGYASEAEVSPSRCRSNRGAVQRAMTSH